MTDPGLEGITQVPAPAPSRPSFSILVTVVCSIMVAIYVGLPLGPLFRDSSPLAQLDRPEDSLERVVTRELDLHEAMRHGLVWEWRLYRVLAGTEDPVRQARAIVDAVASWRDPKRLAEVSTGLGAPMRGLEIGRLAPADRLAARGT